jgi:hypothetical protein
MSRTPWGWALLWALSAAAAAVGLQFWLRAAAQVCPPPERIAPAAPSAVAQDPAPAPGGASSPFAVRYRSAVAHPGRATSETLPVVDVGAVVVPGALP